MKRKREEKNQPSLFDISSIDNLDKIEKKQEAIEKIFEKKKNILKELKEIILEFDKNFPLKKCNFGTAFCSLRHMFYKLDNNIKCVIRHPNLKLKNIKNYHVLKYEEGSSDALVDELKLQIEIYDKNDTFHIKTSIKYDISNQIINDGYISYYPSLLKIDEKEIDKELNFLKDILPSQNTKGVNNARDVRHERNNESTSTNNHTETQSFLQEQTNEPISDSLSRNINFKSKDFRTYSTGETEEELERDRLSEITINSNSSYRIQGVRENKEFKTESNQHSTAIFQRELKFIEEYQEEIVNFLLGMKNEVEKQNFNKSKNIYSTFTQKFRERDIYTKIEEKIQNVILENRKPIKHEKEKIIEDYSLAVLTSSSKNISNKSNYYIMDLVKEKITNQTNDLKKENKDIEKILNTIEMLQNNLIQNIENTKEEIFANSKKRFRK
ncbi:TPA: hypothetical protein ACX8VE_001470 [Campylobacter jejuni]